jgi:hypothetical protein
MLCNIYSEHYGAWCSHYHLCGRLGKSGPTSLGRESERLCHISSCRKKAEAGSSAGEIPAGAQRGDSGLPQRAGFDRGICSSLRTAWHNPLGKTSPKSKSHHGLEIAKIADIAKKSKIEAEHPNPSQGQALTSGDVCQFLAFWALPNPAYCTCGELSAIPARTSPSLTSSSCRGT